MARNPYKTAALIACLTTATGYSPDSRAQTTQPNIVHIFVDDMGWGALSMNDAYGHTSPILTPVLDQLAADGMRFTRAYSAGICSPSRGQIMTGQHGGHAFNDRNVKGFIDQDITVGDVLSDAGYNTAIIGKWGFGGGAGTVTQNLGGGPWTAEERLNDLRINPSKSSNSSANLPTNQGFDHFYGYLNHTHAHHYTVDSLWKTDANGDYELTLTGNGLRDGNGHLLNANGQIVVNGNGQSVAFNGGTPTTSPVNTKTAYTDVLFNEDAKDYISANANQADPFYLQLNYNIPHTRYPAIEFVPGWDTPYLNHPDWNSWTDAQKQYVAMVTQMDKHVGEVLATLEDPDGNPQTNDSVIGNTMIVFVSDNGSDAHPADGQDNQTPGALASNGALLGGKRDLYEGGIRVPMVVRWDGHIQAGTVTDQVTDFADWLPTAADAAGVVAPTGVDGVSIIPTLTGEGIQRQRPWFVWENHEGNAGYATADRFGNSYQDIWAVTMDDIKVVKTVHDSNSNVFYEIFDLANDPTESTPLPFNQATIDAFQAIADAEQLEQGNGYYAYRRSWTGNSGGNLLTQGNWSSAGTPDERWMADLKNTGGTASTVILTQNAELLSIDIHGETASQTLLISNNATLTGRNEIRVGNNGHVLLNNANLASVRWIDVLEGGKLSGNGDITGQVYNAGEVAPGLSPGTLDIDGDYFQLANGALDIEIGGTVAGSTYDQLLVAGDALLGGTLDLSLINGFTPTAGQLFDIIIADAISGTFDTVVAPTGFDASVNYLSTSVSVQFTANGETLAVVMVGAEPSANVIAESSVNGGIGSRIFDENANTNHARGQLFSLGDAGGGNNAFDIDSISFQSNENASFGSGSTLTLYVFSGSEADFDAGSGHSTNDDGDDYFVDTNVTVQYTEVFDLDGVSVSNGEWFDLQLSEDVTLDEEGDHGFLLVYEQGGSANTSIFYRESSNGGRVAVTNDEHATSSRTINFNITGTAVFVDPADLDGDGDVDDADFGIAFAAFTGPNNGPSSNPAADLDGDGDVDDADFGIAFAAFTGPGGPANVPEPTSLALLGLGGLALARRRSD